MSGDLKKSNTSLKLNWWQAIAVIMLLSVTYGYHSFHGTYDTEHDKYCAERFYNGELHTGEPYCGQGPLSYMYLKLWFLSFMLMGFGTFFIMNWYRKEENFWLLFVLFALILSQTESPSSTLIFFFAVLGWIGVNDEDGATQWVTGLALAMGVFIKATFAPFALVMTLMAAWKKKWVYFYTSIIMCIIGMVVYSKSMPYLYGAPSQLFDIGAILLAEVKLPWEATIIIGFLTLCVLGIKQWEVRAAIPITVLIALSLANMALATDTGVAAVFERPDYYITSFALITMAAVKRKMTKEEIWVMATTGIIIVISLIIAIQGVVQLENDRRDLAEEIQKEDLVLMEEQGTPDQISERNRTDLIQHPIQWKTGIFPDGYVLRNLEKMNVTRREDWIKEIDKSQWTLNGARISSRDYDAIVVIPPHKKQIAQLLYGANIHLTYCFKDYQYRYDENNQKARIYYKDLRRCR